AEVEGLTEGNYEVIVKDALGCTASSSITVVDSPNPSIQLISQASSICGSPTGKIEVAVSGGMQGYIYYLNNEMYNSPTWDNLPVGIYRIYAKDQNGCNTNTLQVEITQQDVTLNLSVINFKKPTCIDAPNGRLQ